MRRLSLRTQVLVAVGLVVLASLAAQQLVRMDRRFFAWSWSGVTGLGRYLLGDYAGAARAYRVHVAAVVRAHPDRFDSAWVAYVTGDLARAKQLAQERLAGSRAPRDALLTLGEIALAEGQPKEALRWFREVLRQEADQFDALLLSSVVHARQGASGDAIDALNRALRYDRVETRITAFLTVLETVGELGQRNQEGRPLCLLAHYHRYLRIYDPSHGRPAIRYAERAIAAGDRPADAFLTIGIVERRRERSEAALAAFLKAIELNPGQAQARRWAARIYADRGDLANEYRMIKAAFEAAPRDPYYWDDFYRILTGQLGDYPQALVVAQQVLADDPANAELWRRLGDVQYALGHERAALEHYRRAAELAPDQAQIQEQLGLALMRHGQLDAALAAAEKAVALDPNRPPSYLALGSVYQALRRFRDAQSAYERAVALGGGINPEYLKPLCYLYYQASAFARAEACLRQILAIDPDHVWAQGMLRDVTRNRALEESRRP